MRSHPVPIQPNLFQRSFRAKIAARRPTHCEGQRRDGEGLFNSFEFQDLSAVLGKLTVFRVLSAGGYQEGDSTRSAAEHLLQPHCSAKHSRILAVARGKLEPTRQPALPTHSTL